MSDKPLAYHAYQKLAENYAAKVDTKPHNAYYEKPAMLSLLPDLKGKKVLDAGCGPGAYAEELDARGAKVVSIDASDKMLELASKRLRGRVALKLVDMSKPLDMFTNASFDVVNAPLCADYIEDWNALFAEFFRVLKPGGVFLMSCGHPAFDAEYFKTEKYFSIEQVECLWRGFGIHVNMPSYRRSLEEIMMPFINVGFKIDRVLEPLPTEKFLATDPIRYQTLSHRPCFICIRAVKQLT